MISFGDRCIEDKQLREYGFLIKMAISSRSCQGLEATLFLQRQEALIAKSKATTDRLTPSFTVEKMRSIPAQTSRPWTV